jgi:hypothetical protein
MPRIIWNDPTPHPLNAGNQATVYSSTDGENYKGFHISRGADPSITKDGRLVPGLEGMFTTYNLAKAAIDLHIAKSTIKDVVTVQALP